jgi:ArsR family transcriptional regulator
MMASSNIHLNIYAVFHIFTQMNITPDNLFSSLSHETRLRCLMLLMRHDELCVCELTHAIGAAQPHISRNLAQLRELELVRDRREGLWIHYRINPDLPDWVLNVLDTTFEGIGHQGVFAADENALVQMANRPGAPKCA